MKDNERIVAQRTIYFDYLRVIATFAVMILHISAQNWGACDVQSFDWQVFNFFDSIVRWSVPIFVMISGALFLNRDIPLKKIYTKYISRMATAFIVWSAIYVIVFGGWSGANKIERLLTGHYHMWFILMIIGIYMCIPFIKPLVESEKRTKYFLVLSFIFGFAIPEAKILVNDFGSNLLISFADIVVSSLNNMNIHIVLGYVSYFVLGYYINRIEFSKKQRVMIYCLGIIGFVSTIQLDLIVALKTNVPCSNYYGNFTVNVLFETLGVFTWFKYQDYKFEFLNEQISKLSKYSFGAYLVHVFVIEAVDVIFGINTLSFNPVGTVICIGIIVFVISFTISAVLNQIPVIKKYIV